MILFILSSVLVSIKKIYPAARVFYISLEFSNARRVL